MDTQSALRRIHELRANLGRVVKGHETSIDLLVIALLARGHVLLESVPGEGKTLLATALAASIEGMTSGRVSGQPTLKPSDLLGAEIVGSGDAGFQLIKGPIFNNIVLFDELNRTDPRTQSALLEAMQERRVTIGDTSHPLPLPFHVIATQNPLSHEGTWELDAAAKQRFLIKIEWTFSGRDVEFLIARESRSFLQENIARIRPVISREELMAIQDLVRDQVTLSDAMVHLMNSITVATRRSDPSYPAAAFERAGLGAEVLSRSGGASSRTTAFWPPLLRAHAFFHDRLSVVPYDIFATASAMLNHRLETSYPTDINKVIHTVLAERGYAYEFSA
ncbi:MAG TPA: MoxR family ATPase [Steroidobacteraceae bacterium]|nr:MoxR family ATPase [Steroidobacteraceae bacterium]